MTPPNLKPPQSLTLRNVHLYNDSGEVIGGVYQNGAITTANFYDMCSIFLQFNVDNPQWAIFSLQPYGSNGVKMPRYPAPLPNYPYADQTPIVVTYTQRSSLRRVPSRSPSTPRLTSQIRAREGGRCAVSNYGDIGLEAAHIFPVAGESIWNAMNRGGDWITDSCTPSANKIGGNGIWSPQNGLLLTSSLRMVFGLYKFAINPYNNYKITFFTEEKTALNLDGRRLRNSVINPTKIDGNDRVSDHALRWHFEQGVLKFMRGEAPEQWPDWEYDFAGGDEIGEIMEGPEPGERMELELFTRLGTGDDQGEGEGEELNRYHKKYSEMGEKVLVAHIAQRNLSSMDPAGLNIPFVAGRLKVPSSLDTELYAAVWSVWEFRREVIRHVKGKDEKPIVEIFLSTLHRIENIEGEETYTEDEWRN
ncbi:hypothetical protein AJ79_08602 [Helicocarpus griseus UAMH5409]|uniref:Uncharacterized protein n=1 Tax=Helicocarpus griseus UAMH5409 TaxID=1447875 RepID=A0A2B7WR85_9EURO|nr:hypothetical protein AJ79_08602 [Helicocarpus griseus UAMH5409]